MQEMQVRKILWRRKWQTAPVFLPGKSHGQRSLVGHSPWGHKESDMTEPLNNNSFVHCKANMLLRISPTCTKQQVSVSGKEQRDGEPYSRHFLPVSRTNSFLVA